MSFLLIARNTLRDIMADFNALQVFYERSNIESAMRVGLKDKLALQKVQLQSFQLLDIDLPNKFDLALIETENLNLNVTTVTYQREQEVGKSQGRINKAKQDAEVLINNANSYASKIIGQGLAKAGAIKAKMSQQSPNLKSLVNTLGLTPKQLAVYYFYENLDPEMIGFMNMNLGMPNDVQCLFDPTKC
jgi:regulator of protease activity HflC (stomatin/prohibitin superfamily)